MISRKLEWTFIIRSVSTTAMTDANELVERLKVECKRLESELEQLRIEREI